jgi:hypothetical protein
MDKMTLSTGRVVLNRGMRNGATEAYIADGSEMTHAEWEEYTAFIRATGVMREQAARMARVARNQAAWAADRRDHAGNCDASLKHGGF